MNRRVVVTGIGPVTSMGTGKEEFFQNLLEQKANIREIPDEYRSKYSFKSQHYVPAPDVSLKDFGLPSTVENAMEEVTKFGVAAARLALDDAGLSVESSERYFKVHGIECSDIIIGVGLSSLQTALKSYIAHLFPGDKDILDKYGENPRYNRMVIPMLMPNSISSWISILYGIHGVNYTINASCASGTLAIGEAYMRIKNGCCDTAITGGVECLQEKYGAIMRGFDMLSTLTRSQNGKPMPFSKGRSGFLFNEGAGCILVLEELDRALKRGARIYAEICGYECNSDAYSIVQMENSGERIVKILEKLTQGVKIDYINAHGTGTQQNDEIEARLIQKLFGDMEDQPFINSTKGIIGHSLGASGALEAAVTALSINESLIHGCMIEDPVDNLNLVLQSTKAQIDYGMSASYGFGGHNAVLLFRRYGG